MALVVGCVLAVLVSLFPSKTEAYSIAVDNFSFEALPVGGLPFDGYLGGFFSIDNIPGWLNSGISGQFQPGNPSSTSYFNTLPDGPTIAYTWGDAISQTVGATVQGDVTYVLQVDVGLRKDCCQNLGKVQLLIGGTPILATGVEPSGGDWSTFTASYTGLSADIGKPITIQLSSSGDQGDFDNVRLDATATPVPEPASVSLLALALAAVVWFSSRSSPYSARFRREKGSSIGLRAYEALRRLRPRPRPSSPLAKSASQFERQRTLQICPGCGRDRPRQELMPFNGLALGAGEMCPGQGDELPR